MSTDREDAPVTGIEDHLRLALREALRARDLVAASALPDRADRLRLEAETLRSVLETS